MVLSVLPRGPLTASTSEDSTVAYILPSLLEGDHIKGRQDDDGGGGVCEKGKGEGSPRWT